RRHAEHAPEREGHEPHDEQDREDVPAIALGQLLASGQGLRHPGPFHHRRGHGDEVAAHLHDPGDDEEQREQHHDEAHLEAGPEDGAHAESGPGLERWSGKGRAGCLHPDIVANTCPPVQGQGCWYTTAPPTTVSAGFASRICSGGRASRSRSHTTRSASLPGSSVPFTCSWNSAYALDAVYRERASSIDRRCEGNQPPGGVPGFSRLCRVTALYKPSTGSSGSTAKSVPNATRAPASSSLRHAYAPSSARACPIRSSAQRMSLVACVGCMLAIAPSRAKRGMSAASSTCACSMRWRAPRRPVAAAARSIASSTSRFAASPMACTATC